MQIPQKPFVLASVAALIVTTCLTAQAQPRYTAATWAMAQQPTDIPYSGPIHTIAISPADDSRIIVAAETGGLFRSTDGGHSWEHLDGLKTLFANSVAFLRSNPNIVIATTGQDFQTMSGGGIWKSTDGGDTWKQVCTIRTDSALRGEAYDISVEPGSDHIYVAAADGLYRSDDLGCNFNLRSSSATPLYSVAALGDAGQSVVVGDQYGISYGTNGYISGRAWSFSGSILQLHQITSVPGMPNLVFANGYGYPTRVSTDFGYTWRPIGGFRVDMFGNRIDADDSPPTSNASGGGNQFIKAVYLSRFDTLALYTSDRINTFYKYCPRISGSTEFDYSGNWTWMPMDHPDARDLVFKNNLPFLMSSDGGLHGTSDSAQTWQLIGGAATGLNALQITEVRGQLVDDPINHILRQDLYFTTWHDHLWYTATWALPGPLPILLPLTSRRAMHWIWPGGSTERY